MNVIHFTRGATDPLTSFDASGASFLPLAQSLGNSHICCLYLDSGASVRPPSTTHAAALMVVHGSLTVTTEVPFIRIDVHAGMGCVLDQREAYCLNSGEGAIVLIVESDYLQAHERAISTPERIAGASWEGDSQVDLHHERIPLEIVTATDAS
jgi:hypothetical protein